MLSRLFKARTLPNAPLAMIGAKAGDHVLIVGTHYPALAAELARVAGLNGHAVVVGRESDRAAIETAAAEAGALVDFQPQETGPVAPGGHSFDIAVSAEPLAALTGAARTSRMAEIFAAVRPGGRVIVVDGGSRKRLLWRAPIRPVDSAAVLKLLTAAGGRAVRTLGTVDHFTYHEARTDR